ncbi:MAG: DUF448 domain-containing protein [Deltaproteobacteria bacterium]|nr:DUF448 domain-containing protein [Deltaproteobacteria bacterium]
MKHRGQQKPKVVRPEPARTCLVCRAEKPASSLVALTASGGQLSVGRVSRGRGAHVCATRACLEALDSRAASRAFGAAVEVSASAFVPALHRLAEAKVLEFIGLARRQGALGFGADNIATAPAAVEGGLILLASDLSERGQRHAPPGQVFLDGAAIGHAAGMGYLGAVRLAAGALSDQAAYWLSLWYETQIPDRDAHVDHGSQDDASVVATGASPAHS